MQQVVPVMSVKVLDFVLYAMLAMAIILYVFLNMPDSVSVYLARDGGYAFLENGQGTAGANGHAGCSCRSPGRQNGPEWLQVSEQQGDVFGESVQEYTDSDTGTGAGQKTEDPRPHEDAGSASQAGDGGIREEAGSVYEEEKPKETKHDVSPKGWHLFVDLDEKLMYVYRDGELVKMYEVSGGKPSSPSPLGTWKIISKDTWGEGFGGAWLGFNVPWGKYGIHGTTEPWAVGRYNNSQGCIRMRNSEARELYKLVPHDTLVTIVHENRPFYPMKDGDVGSDVLAVERALKKLGYYHGWEDGIFGSSLKKAVMEFQKENKLYVTGVINNSTYEKIMEMEREYDKKQARLKKEQEERMKQPEKEPEQVIGAG